MSLKLGSTTIGSLYLGSTKVSEAYLGNVKVYGATPPMAANTLLFRFSDSTYDPSSLTTLTGATWTQISAEPNVWLWDASSVQTTDWSSAFFGQWASDTNQVALIGAGDLTTPLILGQDRNPWHGIFANNSYLVSVCSLNIPNATNCSRMFNKCLRLADAVVIRCPSATTITDMFGGSNTNSNTAMTSATIITSSSLVTANQAFRGCTALRSFTISDTSSVLNLAYMCVGCTSLQTVPLLATGAAQTVTAMFDGCRTVASGSLDLYWQMANQTPPPSIVSYCFRNCGADTVTGRAELAQIPTSWGGTMRI